MKPIILSLVAFVFVTSCSPDTLSRTREKAIENVCYSLLNFMVEYYTHAYYSLPEDAEALFSFVDKWKAIDSNFVYYEDSYAMTLSELSSSHMDFAYYGDSLFIYTETPHAKVGCCVYGTPFYWLAHPDRYDPFRHDYYYQFRPSAYSESGDYLFEEEFDYTELSKLIDSLNVQYKSIIAYDGFFYDDLSRTPYNTLVPFISIVSFRPDQDDIEVLTPILPADSLYVYNKTDDTYKRMQRSLEEECKEYMNELVAILKDNSSQYNNVARIIMGIRWCCK